jgi:hypothetical protein
VSCGAARDTTAARILLVSALLVTVVWAWAVLARTQDFVPWLRVAVVVIGLVAVDGLSAGRRFPASRMGRRLGIVVAGAALLTALAEPAAYAVDTAASPHGGAIPSAGPSAAFGTGSFRGDPGGFGHSRGGFDGFAPFRRARLNAGFGASPSGPPPSGRSRAPGGHGGRIGGLLGGSNPSSQARRAGAGRRQPIYLGSRGGRLEYRGRLPARHQRPGDAGGRVQRHRPVTHLKQFEQYVAQRKIHYFVGGGSFGRPDGGANTSRQIEDWVAPHFTGRMVDSVTLYDLTAAAS